MKVELEFLDKFGTCIHEDHLVYDQAVPVPTVGDLVIVNGKTLKVDRRLFIYHLDNVDIEAFFPDLKISFTLSDPLVDKQV